MKKSSVLGAAVMGLLVSASLAGCGSGEKKGDEKASCKAAEGDKASCKSADGKAACKTADGTAK